MYFVYNPLKCWEISLYFKCLEYLEEKRQSAAKLFYEAKFNDYPEREYPHIEGKERNSLVYYVYIYCDPRTYGPYKYDELFFECEPFYVGKGKKYRLYAHLEYAKDPVSKRGQHKTFKIRRILSEGLEPIILKWIENVSNEEALKIEADMIEIIGRSDLKQGPLVNFTNGGGRGPGDNGLEGYKHTEETKKKISRSGKGKKKPEDFKEKISKLKKGNTNMLGKKHDKNNLIKRERNKIQTTLTIMISSGLEFTEENYNKCIPSISYSKYAKIHSYFTDEELNDLIHDIRNKTEEENIV